MISVSLGKIAQSRVQRSGCSLHKSLMVASILQKARHLYVEQAFMLHCRPQAPAPAPAAAEPAPTYTDLDSCNPAERGVTPADSAEPARRKRLISDEETEEAVASILPKRARTEACCECEAEAADDVTDAPESDSPAASPCDSPVPESSAPASESDSKDADSDDSDDSCYESGDSDDSEADAMEIDRITSLVSVFSFDSLKLRQQTAATDSCSSQRTGDWELPASDPVAVRA